MSLCVAFFLFIFIVAKFSSYSSFSTFFGSLFRYSFLLYLFVCLHAFLFAFARECGFAIVCVCVCANVFCLYVYSCLISYFVACKFFCLLFTRSHILITITWPIHPVLASAAQQQKRMYYIMWQHNKQQSKNQQLDQV